MSKKFTLQLVISLALLAAVLIFLGVNYVPQIFASSQAQDNLVASGIQARPNYVDEGYPRAIASRSTYANSDWIERHPAAYYTNSDWIERHSIDIYANSDWIERHPVPQE
jgi:hypothetical protein